MRLYVSKGKHYLTYSSDGVFYLPEGSSTLAQAIWANELTKCALELF